MFDYGSFGSSPGRRRRRRPPWLAVAVTVLLLVAGAYLVMRHDDAAAAPAQPPPAHAVAGRPAVTTQAVPVTLGACLDATMSLVSSFPVAIRRDLALGVASLAPTGILPTSAADGRAISAAQPAIHLIVRQVDTFSYSSVPTRFQADVSVPGVPGLAESRPSPLSGTYDTQLEGWSRGYQEVAAARHAASVAAGEAAQALAAMPLDQSARSLSGISACVSGLLSTTPATGRRSYLLASDLQENVPPQLAGSFHHAPLLIVQACDSGNATYCQGLLAHFEMEMRRLDVGTVTVVRPEVAQQAIANWIHTGGSGP